MTEIKLRNGRTLEEALAKIGEYKEPKKYLQDKYPYYKFGEYKSRLDEAFELEAMRLFTVIMQLLFFPLWKMW